MIVDTSHHDHAPALTVDHRTGRRSTISSSLTRSPRTRVSLPDSSPTRKAPSRVLSHRSAGNGLSGIRPSLTHYTSRHMSGQLPGLIPPVYRPSHGTFPERRDRTAGRDPDRGPARLARGRGYLRAMRAAIGAVPVDAAQPTTRSGAPGRNRASVHLQALPQQAGELVAGAGDGQYVKTVY